MLISKNVDLKSWTFPGGEVGVKINNVDAGDVLFTIKGIPTSDDIMRLIHSCDAVNQLHPGDMQICVFLSYLPYARQDRVCHLGENFGLDVFVRMLSILKNISVVTSDVQSPVAAELFKKIFSPFL